MMEEVEETIRNLPEGKSSGADNIPSELLKHGGNELVPVTTSLCQKIWETKTVARRMDSITFHPPTQKWKSPPMPELQDDKPHQPHQ